MNEELLAIKKYEIETALDRIDDFESVTDQFGERVVESSMSSESVGYKVITTYIYAEAYNTEGVFGGYSLQDMIDELVELGGVS